MSSYQLSETELEKLKVKLQEEGVVRCPSEGCSETFKSIWGLRFHLKKNTCNAPKFKCDKCNEGFSTRIILQQHCESCPGEDNKNKKVVDSGTVGNKEVSGLKRTFLQEKEDVTVANKKSKSSESTKKDSTIVSDTERETIEITSETSSTTTAEEELAHNSINASEHSSQKTDISDVSENVFIPDIIKGTTDRVKHLNSSTTTEENETSADKSHDKLVATTDSCNVSNNTSKQKLNEPQKRKRGRPKKSETQCKKKQKVVTSEANLNREEFVTPKKKPARKKKTAETPKDKVTPPSRRSSRSTVKKVNYAHIDSSEDDNDDDDDDDENGIATTTPKSAPNKNKEVDSCGVNNATASPTLTPKASKDGAEKPKKRGRPKRIRTTTDNEKQNNVKDKEKIVEKQSQNIEDDNISIDAGDKTGVHCNDKEKVITEENSKERNTDEHDKLPPKKRGRKKATESKCKSFISSSEKETAVQHNDKDIVASEENSQQENVVEAVKVPKKRGRKKANENKSEVKVIKEQDGQDTEQGNNVANDINNSPKKKGRKTLTEEERVASLKAKARKGQLIHCDYKCGKKFSSYLGYKIHMDLCGKETREVIKCEICQKEYNTLPGLKYHMKSAHTEKPVVEKKPTEDNKTGDREQLVSESGKALRHAAVRAMERVQDLKKTKIEEAQGPVYKRYEHCDAYILKQRQGLITHAMLVKWKEEIKTNGPKNCPNEACTETFTSVHVLQTHFLQCGFDEAPYKCKECEKEFLTITGARYHVESMHLKEPENEENNSEDDYIEESEEEEDEEEDGDVVIDAEDELQELEEPKRKHNVKKKINKTKTISVAFGVWSRAYRMHDRWKTSNIDAEQIYQEHMPVIHHWCRVTANNIPEYIPVSTKSPHFIISRPNNKNSDNLEDSQLSLFTSLDKNSSGKYGDRTFYAGGPVWGLSWCPTSDISTNVDQFIVVSTHRSYETVYHAYKCHKGKGTLQVWNLGKLSSNSSRSGDSPKLALCIAHDFGPIYKMIWCPFGTWQQPDATTDDDCVPRLGLLAVACGDGIVRILSIPYPDKLLSKLPVLSHRRTGAVQGKEFYQVMVHGPSLIDLFPCALNGNYNGQRGMALCVDWSRVKPFHRIAAGFSDGSVAVWNLSSKSALLTKTLENQHHTLRMAPFVLINAHSSLVRDLAFCPTNQDIIVTGGEERSYKIWDLKSPCIPLIILKKGLPCEIEWPLHTNGFLCCEQDLFNNNHPALKHCDITTVDYMRVVCPHGSAIWSLSFNLWLHLAASSDVAGDVYVSKDTMKCSSTKWPLYKVHLEDRNSNVNTESNQKKSPNKFKQECPSIQQTIRCSRLVFRDINSLQFHNDVLTSRKEIQEAPSSYSANTSTLQSINKVRWNPNKQARTWIASGGTSGLLRIHNVKDKSHSHHSPPDELDGSE